MRTVKLYDLKQVGKDFIIVTDGRTCVKITCADTSPGMDFINPTREEHAAFFKHTDTSLPGERC